MTVLRVTETVSVTEASERGVSAIVRAAGEGHDIVVERHGHAIAAVVEEAMQVWEAFITRPAG